MKRIEIDQNNANQRVDKYLKKLLPAAPKSFIYKTLRKKDVKVNNKWVKEHDILKLGDILTLYISDLAFEDFSGSKLFTPSTYDFEVIYEDEHVLMINKDQGVLVQGDASIQKSLNDEVLSYLYEEGVYDPTSSFKPAAVHRLDKGTSGIVVFGKTLPALQLLNEMMMDKNAITKTYQTIVYGQAKKKALLTSYMLNPKDSPLCVLCDANEEGAKQMVTQYYCLKQSQEYALLEVTLLTGRKHQIRLQLAAEQLPIIGDHHYGSKAVNQQMKTLYHLNHQWLHAYSLTFHHASKELAYLNGQTFVAPLSKKLENIKKSIFKK